MKKLLLLLLLAPFAPAVAYDRGELAEFNDLYKGDRFEEALEGYAKITAVEPANPWGWYNAGNAFFRLNRPGPAVYHFAKAFRLNPRDPNIRFNFEFALRQTGQTLVPEGLPRALHYMYYLLADREILALAVCLFWLACLAGAAGFLLDGAAAGAKASRAGLLTGLLCLACLAWLGARQNSPFAGAGVVIKNGGARLLSGPGENFKACASAPEGLLVKVLNSDDDNYYEVGLTKEGVKGWALKTEVEKL
ncbi:MAG TPA: hypothetical protein PKI19_07690 [Elusimicrobiales bacterium]|nr:hypothetical protein [Elusimicrobiales bacterium]